VVKEVTATQIMRAK